MSEPPRTIQGFIKPLAIFCLSLVAIVAGLVYFGGNLLRLVRESLMQRVTSSHYEIRCPPGALSQSAMTDFARQREPLFAALNKKLGDADSNMEVRVVFDPHFSEPPYVESNAQAYTVTGTTVRTKLNGPTPHLPAAADAEALLYEAWGKPGNAQIARWISIWLVGDWRGAEIGMAAAQVEQRLGHKKWPVCWSIPAAKLRLLRTGHCWARRGSARWLNSGARTRFGDSTRRKWRIPASPK